MERKDLRGKRQLDRSKADAATWNHKEEEVNA